MTFRIVRAHPAAAWALAVLVATLGAGCFAIDNFGRAPIVQNLTDDTIWTYFTRPSLPGPNDVYAIGPDGQASVVTNTDTDCVPMERFYVVAEDPEEVADPPVLVERDLTEQPMCAHEIWTFDGQQLREVDAVLRVD